MQRASDAARDSVGGDDFEDQFFRLGAQIGHGWGNRLQQSIFVGSAAGSVAQFFDGGILYQSGDYGIDGMVAVVIARFDVIIPEDAVKAPHLSKFCRQFASRGKNTSLTRGIDTVVVHAAIKETEIFFGPSRSPASIIQLPGGEIRHQFSDIMFVHHEPFQFGVSYGPIEFTHSSFDICPFRGFRICFVGSLFLLDLTILFCVTQRLVYK